MLSMPHFTSWLKMRRNMLCERMATKTLKHTQSKDWYSFNTETRYNTQSSLPLLKTVPARNHKYHNSSIVQFTELINTKRRYRKTKHRV